VHDIFQAEAVLQCELCSENTRIYWIFFAIDVDFLFATKTPVKIGIVPFQIGHKYLTTVTCFHFRERDVMPS
jgi:hypothetical protein